MDSASSDRVASAFEEEAVDDLKQKSRTQTSPAFRLTPPL